jgi:3D (Asp-Asp-Asp) domain-containing protein/peptidoglycan hydrolase CwlO-like protein
VVASRAVGERAGLGGLLVLALFAAVTGLQLPAASGAESPSGLREQADSLRAENGSLHARERTAWLSLVSLETRLEQSRAALMRLTLRTTRIERELVEAEHRLGIARRAVHISEQRLAMRVRALYEQGEADPLAVVLGSSSIGEAMEGLESLDRAAAQDRDYIRQAKRARANLVSLTRALAAREALARQAQEAAAATAASLEHARGERAAAVAQLQAQRQANAAQASSLDARARALAASSPRPSLPTPPVAGGKTLTVSATGYSLSGVTATGVPVGWGVAAVDPGVIPLGTRMTIPGYGAAVAADTGGAVVGARIDLWFPTRAEALAWGTRTVTITLH